MQEGGPFREMPKSEERPKPMEPKEYMPSSAGKRLEKECSSVESYPMKATIGFNSTRINLVSLGAAAQVMGTEARWPDGAMRRWLKDSGWLDKDGSVRAFQVFDQDVRLRPYPTLDAAKRDRQPITFGLSKFRDMKILDPELTIEMPEDAVKSARGQLEALRTGEKWVQLADALADAKVAGLDLGVAADEEAMKAFEEELARLEASIIDENKWAKKALKDGFDTSSEEASVFIRAARLGSAMRLLGREPKLSDEFWQKGKEFAMAGTQHGPTDTTAYRATKEGAMRHQKYLDEIAELERNDPDAVDNDKNYYETLANLHILASRTVEVPEKGGLRLG